MLVKINGKEVEVGASKHIQKKLDINKNFSKKFPDIRQSVDCPKMIIDDKKVDINDPRLINKAALISKKIGLFFTLIGFSLVVFDVLMAIGLIYFGLMCRFYVPKKMEKILDELRKQGKVPSKY